MVKILTFESFITESYNKPRAGGKRRWSVKYKKKIDCNNPKGFSQKQYCKRKRRGGHYKSESVLFKPQHDEVKEILSEIFLEVSDRTSEKWFHWVDKNSGGRGDEYEVYISFGDEEPYNRIYADEEDWLSDPSYGEVVISDDLVECIKRAIDYMKDLGMRHRITFNTEYSSDPTEDEVEEVSINDIKSGMFMQENQCIRINFFKD